MRFYSLILVYLLIVGCSQLPHPIHIPDTPPPAPALNHAKVALVLSGGGARGVAHAGVLEILEENDIKIDLIVGASAGSIIGALYADTPNAQTLKKKIIALKKWDFLDLEWSAPIQMFWHPRGVAEGNLLRRFLQKNLNAHDFAALKIPLAVVATDLTRGEAMVLRSGPLIPAVHASSAIPMLFSPVKMYGAVLVDGGVASPVPVEIARAFSPEIVIAVDIGTMPDKGPIGNNYQVVLRSLHIPYYNLSNWQTKQADVVIHPDVEGFGAFSDHANEALYEAGKIAALKALPSIRKKLTLGKNQIDLKS